MVAETIPGSGLLAEAGSPEWFQRYHLRITSTFRATLSTDLSNAAASGLGDYANDAAAAAGGVALGQLYRNGSVLQVRVT